MPGCKSARYSPVSLLVTVRTAPVALLVIVTSADLITAWLLSVTVPCRVAVAVACPHMLTQLNSSRLLISAINNHRLRFIPFCLLQNGGNFWSPRTGSGIFIPRAALYKSPLAGPGCQ